jgi:hypothetical protein
MLAEAREAPGVEYRLTAADATGLDDASADIVTCSQSFHWMDRAATLVEGARILRRGGIFAAYEYDLPPLTLPVVDEAFEAVLRTAGYADGSSQAIAADHLAVLRESRLFQGAREALFHAVGETDAARLAGFARSLGQVGRALVEGRSDEELGLDRLAAVAMRAFKGRGVPIWWSYRVTLAVRA